MRSPVQSWVALQENPTATQWGFLFEGRSSSLESGRKTKKPRRAQPAGFSTLGLFCRPYQDAEPREAILGAAQPAGFSTLGLFCRPYQDAEPREAILGRRSPRGSLLLGCFADRIRMPSHARQSWGRRSPQQSEAILGAAQPAAKRGNPGNDTSNVIANNFITNNIITNKFIVYLY